jgi:hypothetical protein
MTEIGVSNDQSHFFGMFGKVIEETDIDIHTLRRMDDIVFRAVIQQLEFMVEWDG